jgi:hypothetical protein
MRGKVTIRVTDLGSSEKGVVSAICFGARGTT